MSDPQETDEPLGDDGWDLCFCGCTRNDHDPSGRCRFCFSDDCGGFEYDHESTCIAGASEFPHA